MLKVVPIALFVGAAAFVSTSSLRDTRTDAAFKVVLNIAISTTLLSYLLIFPAVIRLRYTHPHVHRPYRVPGGTAGAWSGMSWPGPPSALGPGSCSTGLP